MALRVQRRRDRTAWYRVQRRLLMIFNAKTNEQTIITVLSQGKKLRYEADRYASGNLEERVA